jgi:hypothetical protein
MLNVLSRILFKLSVALIVKVVTVSFVTIVGFPDKAPLLIFNVIPEGKLPAKTLYLILVDGETGDADNIYSISYPYGYDPIDPAAVFQIGCAILCC